MGANKVQKVFNDALKTLPTRSEPFDSYTSDQEPPAPWVVEKSSTPMASAYLVDGGYSPGGVQPSRSVRLDGETNQFVSITADYKAATTVLGRFALMSGGVQGSHSKLFRLVNSSTGHTVFQVDRHSDGHIWTYNGATPVDLGALAGLTFQDFAVWLDIVNKKFVLYVHHTRWPAAPPNNYDFIATEVPDTVEFRCEDAGDLFCDFVDDWSNLKEFDFDAETNGNPPSSPWTVFAAGPGSPYVQCDNSVVNPGRWWLPAGVLSCKFHVSQNPDIAYIKQSITPGDFIAFNIWERHTTVYHNDSPQWYLYNSSLAQKAVGLYWQTDGHVYTRDALGYIDLGPCPAGGWAEFSVFVDMENERFYIIRERENSPVRFPSTAGTYYTFQNSVTPDEVYWYLDQTAAPTDWWVDDLWWSMDAWFSDFDEMALGAPPTDPPWTTQWTDPPMVRVVDTPHQGASGKALKVWPGPDASAGYARGTLPIYNFRQVFEFSLYLYFLTNKTSASKRFASLIDTYTGDKVLSVKDNSDGTLLLSNGAGWATGPAFNIDTWYSLAYHVDLVKRAYYVTIGTTRYPTTGTYALTGAQVPNAFRVEAVTTDNGLVVDTLLATFNVLLRNLEVSPVYPRKSITGKPFITTNLSALSGRWGWSGRDNNGRRSMLYEGSLTVTTWVPRAHATANIVESESDTELLDNLIDAVASTIMDQRLTLESITKVTPGSPTGVALERDGKFLYRALPVRFQHWEVM